MKAWTRSSSPRWRAGLGRALADLGVGCGFVAAAIVGACTPDFDKLTANASCANGTQDGDETGPDCGGRCAGIGLKCELSLGCLEGSDCKSNACLGNLCVLTTNLCANDTLDSGETGVDCGGTCAPGKLCSTGVGCLSASDCSSAYCSPEGVCAVTPCANEAQDEGETGVDCGGICAPSKLCSNGTGCLAASDCTSAYCSPTGVCAVTPCANETLDEGETGVDCGGVCAPAKRCGGGLGCLVAADCVEGSVCLPDGTCGVLVVPCANNIKDQGEGDQDCGAVCAPKLCAIDRTCGGNSDCASGICAKGKCVLPGCANEAQDQTESDVDCGGGCTKCDDTRKCGGADDCKSGVCKDRICVPQTCSDELKSAALGETNPDCGGACTSVANGSKRCVQGQRCLEANDCFSFVCAGADKVSGLLGTCGAAITVPATNMIDDFEDDDRFIIRQQGREGNHYTFNDGTSGATMLPPAGTYQTYALAGARGTTSLFATHIAGSGFTSWGAGYGLDFNNPTGGGRSKLPYDCSAHKGVGFWARTGDGKSFQVTVLFPSLQTDSSPGTLCTVNPVPPATTVPKELKCEDHFGVSGIIVGGDWKYIKVPFAGSAQAGFGMVFPALDTTILVGLQVRIAPNTPFDLWIDDVAFYD